MNRGGVRQMVLASCLLMTPAASMAQTAGDSSGSIVGTIADETGAVVPAVKVCVSGPGLMSARCVDSDADGAFRFPALPPGEYTVSFTVGGFEPTEREGVRVGLGETASVPVTVVVAPTHADVTVEGRAHPLDRFATSRAAGFTAEQLASLPGPRSMGGIVAAAPAVLMTRHDVGGNTALAPGPWSAYGVAGYSLPTLDGISIANLNAFGLTLDYGSFEHVWLGLGAYGSDQPGPGIHMQALTKSGGNRYRGTVYAAMEHESWQSHNVDANQIERGAAGSADVRAAVANRLAGYHDVDGDVGGFVRRDRLWWYSSVREQTASQLRVTFPVEPVETRAWNATGKLTARLGSRNRVIVFAHRNLVRQPIRLDGFLLSGERAINESKDSTTEQVSKGTLWKSEWSADVRGRLFLEARVGQFLMSRAESPNGVVRDSLRFEDTATGAVTGVNREWRTDLRRSQLTASLSWLTGAWGGTHLLEAGGEVVRDVSGEEWIHGYAGDVLHVLQNGAPAEVYLWGTPARSESGQWWYAWRVNDSWQATDRLSLNAGLRFDRFRVFLPGQAHPVGRFSSAPVSFPAVDDLIDWNVVAPRLGVSYALGSGDSTIVKGTYGLYWLPPSTDFGFNGNPNARAWLTRYGWSDLNASGVWEPGEQGALLERRGGVPAEGLDPFLRLPYMHEATLRVQHAAGAHLAFSTGVVWRAERQQGVRQPAELPFELFTVRVSRRDPGPDGREGTGDDGRELMLYDVPAGSDLTGGNVRNVDRSASDYFTWEAAADRRFSNRWALSTSFAYTWNRDQANAYLNQPVRENAYPLTPNDLIHTDGRGRHVFGVWSAKAVGTFTAPWEVRATSLIRHQSGQPFGRTFQAQLPTYGTARVLAEPIGARRQDHVTIVDARLERPFRRQWAQISGFLEISNLLNANPEQNVNWSSGNSFLRPLSIVSPRIARIGVRLDW
jgi:hypothetical protein